MALASTLSIYALGLSSRANVSLPTGSKKKTITVQRKMFEGIMYLVDKEDLVVYDYDLYIRFHKQRKIGVWNSTSKAVIFNTADSEEDTDDSEEDTDDSEEDTEEDVDREKNRTRYEALPDNFGETTACIQTRIKEYSQNILDNTNKLLSVKANKAKSTNKIAEIKTRLKKEQLRKKTLQAKENQLKDRLASYKLKCRAVHKVRREYLARVNPYEIVAFK